MWGRGIERSHRTKSERIDNAWYTQASCIRCVDCCSAREPRRCWTFQRKESSSKDWLYTPSCAIQQTASVQCLEELHLPPKTEALIAVRIAADGETSGPTQTNPLPSVAWTLTLIENEVGIIRTANTDCMPLTVLRGTIIKKAATIIRTPVSRSPSWTSLATFS